MKGNEQTKKLPRTEWGGSQSKRDNQFVSDVSDVYERDAMSVVKVKNNRGYTQAIHTISFARGDQVRV